MLADGMDHFEIEVDGELLSIESWEVPFSEDGAGGGIELFGGEASSYEEIDFLILREAFVTD
jgi:hypothetical protein